MKPFSTFVSLHPYFKAHPGKVEAAKAIFSRFVEKTAKEKDNLFYSFSVNGDEIFCREAYESAEGLLAHLENVSAPLAEMLKVAELIRVEVHGPAEELEKLKAGVSDQSELSVFPSSIQSVGSGRRDFGGGNSLSRSARSSLVNLISVDWALSRT